MFTGYRRLFEVRLLHHYWLDEGVAVFDSLSEKRRNELLLLYNHQFFLSVEPTASSKALLRNLHCVFKRTTLGFVVAVSKNVLIPDDTVFEFFATVENSSFFNYTSLTLPERKIYELYHKAEDKTYRYKEQVPTLSNLTGTLRTMDYDDVLFLSKGHPSPTDSDRAESLVKTGAALHQLKGDAPGAVTFVLNTDESKSPVYVHQDDVNALTPPAGLEGVPANGIQLTDDMPDNIFALIQIHSVCAGNDNFSCTANKFAREKFPVFEVRFKNRSTVWKYFNKSSGVFVSNETESLPLTYYKNAGTKRKPSEGTVKASYNAERSKLVRFFSQEAPEVIATFLSELTTQKIIEIKALFPDVDPTEIDNVLDVLDHLDNLSNDEKVKITAFFSKLNPWRISELFSEIYE